VPADGRVASGSRSDAGFPRSCRLTSRRQYQEVYRRGVRVRASSLALFGLANGVGTVRLGITATRKCGGAVRRNRIKRVLREVFRLHRSEWSALGIDVVVNARPGAPYDSFQVIEREFVDAFRRLARRIGR
jgi:ribonuclease P protein component